MAKLLHMPEVSANATHAAIQNWTLKEGDTISAGDCIAEIETEKALVELAAEEDAVLIRHERTDTSAARGDAGQCLSGQLAGVEGAVRQHRRRAPAAGAKAGSA